MNSLLEKDLVAELLNTFHRPYEQRKIREFLQHRSDIGQDEGLESIPLQVAGEILSDISTFRKEIFAWTKAQNEHTSGEREIVTRKQAKEARMRAYQRKIPDLFKLFTPEKNPCPNSFVFIRDFFQDSYDELNETTTKTSLRGLYIYGKARKGKTACVWQSIEHWLEYDHGELWEFVESEELAEAARKSHHSGDPLERFDDLKQRCIEAELLVLDDIGTEKMATDSKGETKVDAFEVAMKVILDKRTTNLDRFTIITSNMAPGELGKRFSDQNRDKIIGRFNDYFMTFKFEDLAG